MGVMIFKGIYNYNESVLKTKMRVTVFIFILTFS